ncbi:leucine-rich repeat-containing protein 74A-like [Ylistrum balloti]|uniref:leucine-rich repeat-containing protein 74A-like n=1 Tax=Ylistrum balloti TaxID=509963 RepID=UPI002905D440|nr:leucine-rich repeat-containing protein 74A-like [Ylistrum balloti]
MDGAFQCRSPILSTTPSLPSIPRPASINLKSERSFGSGRYSNSSGMKLPNSAKMRKKISKEQHSRSNSKNSDRNSPCSALSKTSAEIRRTAWMTGKVLGDDVYEEKKERLLRTSKLKKDLEVYFNVETPSRLAKRTWVESDDDEYDTDLDTDLGMELIIDERTKQIKDDGDFPEYKNLCRKLKTVPNNYFIRHSVDDELTMRHRYLSAKDCQAIGWEVENHLTFKKVDLEDNGLGPKQMIALAEMLLKNKYVTEVNLSNNPMGSFGSHISKIILLNNSHIVKVDLTGNDFGIQGGENFAEVIETNVYLKEIRLGKNKIEDAGAIAIGRALEANVTLEYLDLSWNKIGKQGAAKIATGIKVNSTLKTLILSMNGLGNSGCQVMMEGLRGNEALTTLDLSANRITDAAVDYIIRVLPYHKSLTSLKLSHNQLSAEGAFKILKPLTSKFRKKLSYLELDGTDVNSDLMEVIENLNARRGLVISIKRPPSRRSKTLDQLTRVLSAICRFLIKEGLDIKTVFPDLEKEREESYTTYDIIEIIRNCGEEFNRTQVTELRKICKELRHRTLLLKEFEHVYDLVLTGRDPTAEDPLRTPFAGKRRGGQLVSLPRRDPNEPGQLTLDSVIPGVRFQ